MNVKGLSAVVTGGGSGLGEATASALTEQGVKVALLDLNEAAANDVAGRIGAVAVKCNVSSAESVEAALAAAEEHNGAARICVNCAGIADAGRIVGRNGPLPLEAFDKVIQVNLVGSFNVMRLAAARMTELDPLDEVGERGMIINTASVAAFEGQVGQAAYSASKGGIAALTLPAAREFAQFGVRVCTIAPGVMDTPMVGGMTEEVRDSLAASVPFPKRLGTAEEYASLALHLLQNQFMNGEVVRMDGAIRMQPR